MMNMSHEYNIAREHVSEIDFTYLVPSGSRTFSTRLPDPEEMDIPDAEEADGSAQAQGWVDSRLEKEKDQHSPTTIAWFETTIRYLGGLISAFELSGDPLMLDRATELGNWLLPAFATQYGLPLARYAIGTNPDGQRTGRLTLAEVGSNTLEMTRLSELTGDEIYYRAVSLVLARGSADLELLAGPTRDGHARQAHVARAASADGSESGGRTALARSARDPLAVAVRSGIPVQPPRRVHVRRARRLLLRVSRESRPFPRFTLEAS